MSIIEQNDTLVVGVTNNANTCHLNNLQQQISKLEKDLVTWKVIVEDKRTLALQGEVLFNEMEAGFQLIEIKLQRA
jgi:hypothetical protein